MDGCSSERKQRQVERKQTGCEKAVRVRENRQSERKQTERE
jgi:hypothetical protein